MILQPSQDETNTVLQVIQESPHLFLDDIQQELSTSHGLMLSLLQIFSIFNSTAMPHKQLATEQANEQKSSKIAERKKKPVWFLRECRAEEEEKPPGPAVRKSTRRKITKQATPDLDWDPPETIISRPLSADPVESGMPADQSFAADIDIGADSDPITPPPVAKRSATKRAAPESINDSDSASEAEPKRKKKKKQEQEKEKEKARDPNRKLLIYIPQGGGGSGTKRKTLTHAVSFDDVLDIIYGIVGCTDVAVKPKLSYKLSNAVAKADAVSLYTEDDWEGCLEDVMAAEKTKKANTGISVRINVTEQYMSSLLAMKGKHGASKKKGKVQILDLEHAGSGDDDFDEGTGIMGTESKHFEQLQKMYSRCQMCGPEKACKINSSGTHQPLSHNQLRAWARSLVRNSSLKLSCQAKPRQAAETHGVTLQTPPKAQLFAMFFKTFGTASTAPAPVQPQSPFGAMPPYMGGNPYAFMAPWMQGMPPAFSGNPMAPTSAYGSSSHGASTSTSSSTLPSSSSHASTSALPSSDPHDMDAANPYPEIAAFIATLSLLHSRRNLAQYLDRFDELDFYNIDEISKLGTAEELTRLVGMTAGNAAFLLAQVKTKMRRVDRATRAVRA
ncbi:hypothetical protein FB451DRAFT_1378089 [Mycena latifolia]|nr:hypothetical protein FB451DRAFT_1378089 [Mycena latifolia]